MSDSSTVLNLLLFPEKSTTIKKNRLFLMTSSFCHNKFIRNYLLPIEYSFRFFLRDRFTLHGRTLCRKLWVFSENDFKHFLSLLMPTLSILISPKNLTTFLLQHTERSATVFSTRHFGIKSLAPIHF